MLPNRKIISVPLDIALKGDLEKLANVEERKLAAYVRKVLKEHVNKAREAGRLPKQKSPPASV